MIVVPTSHAGQSPPSDPAQKHRGPNPKPTHKPHPQGKQQKIPPRVTMMTRKAWLSPMIMSWVGAQYPPSVIHVSIGAFLGVVFSFTTHHWVFTFGYVTVQSHRSTSKSMWRHRRSRSHVTARSMLFLRLIFFLFLHAPCQVVDSNLSQSFIHSWSFFLSWSRTKRAQRNTGNMESSEILTLLSYGCIKHMVMLLYCHVQLNCENFTRQGHLFHLAF